MIIKEYRIVMPLSVEEFQIGQLYSVTEASKNETGGGEGVEILENEPFTDVPLFVPGYIRKVAPQGSLAIHEKSWNAYPYCRTELTNPSYMKDNFYVKIESLHLMNDRGTTENAHNLPPELLSKRTVVNINIANDKEFLEKNDVHPETSPSLYVSKKTNRGGLGKTWREDCEPVMCAYKLVTVHFKWFGLQKIVESFAHKQYPRLFSKFHREVFCWMDKWYGLTMADIRELEKLAKAELDEARKSGTVRGITTA